MYKLIQIFGFNYYEIHCLKSSAVSLPSLQSAFNTPEDAHNAHHPWIWDSTTILLSGVARNIWGSLKLTFLDRNFPSRHNSPFQEWRLASWSHGLLLRHINSLAKSCVHARISTKGINASISVLCPFLAVVYVQSSSSAWERHFDSSRRIELGGEGEAMLEDSELASALKNMA